MSDKSENQKARKQERVAVGLSGGVDSAVATAMLLEQGYLVTAFYIEAYNEPGCRTDQDKKDALKIALQLGVSFEVVDLREAYKTEVTSYFYHEYEAGRTPNPDVMCNREIKFGLFYEMMIARGFDYVATGHYVRAVEAPSLSSSKPIKLLQMAQDRKKDQSYFLAEVPVDRLARVLFPLGEMNKTQVRERARELGLVVSDKPDSFGICFVGEVDVPTLLGRKLGASPGEILLEGEVVGVHQGIWTATIGERIGKGFVLESKKLQAQGVDTTKMPSWYVVGKDTKKNQIKIGRREQCYVAELLVSGLETLVPLETVMQMISEKRLFVRVRNLGKLYPVAKLARLGAMWNVATTQPVFAPSPGQLAVLYGDWREDVMIAQEGLVCGYGQIFT